MPYRQYSIGHVLYLEHYNFPFYNILYLMFLHLCICLYCFKLYRSFCVYSTEHLFYLHWTLNLLLLCITYIKRYKLM